MPFNKEVSVSTIYKIRSGKGDNPFIEIDEPLVIDNGGKVHLTEFPSTYHKVIVTGDNREWFETNAKIPNVNQYKVDYEHKTVTFNIANIGKQLSFNYQGTGNAFISANSVYTEVNNGTVTETLHDIITDAKSNISESDEKIALFTTNENERLANESSRKSNEQTRKANEDIRIANENERITSETTRKNSETTRVANENSRITAETNRENAELLRVTAEEIREQNEDSRELAESTRQTSFNSKIDEVNSLLPNVMNLENVKAWNNTTQYYKNNIVEYLGSSFMALKDSLGQTPPTLPIVSNEFWHVLAKKGVDGNGALVLYQETFNGIKGQTDFTLKHHYDLMQNRIFLIVGGAMQFSPYAFQELSTNSVRLNSPLTFDTEVVAVYFGQAPAITNDLQLQIDSINEVINYYKLSDAKTHMQNGDIHVTLADKTNWNSTLTSAKTYTDTKVAGIVDSAPETLNTLNELAQALGDDPNFATTVATQIGTKVDKVDGKGLSTNDYTTVEKNKLSGISDNATKVESSTTNGNIKINGVETKVFTPLSPKMETFTSTENQTVFNLTNTYETGKNRLKVYIEGLLQTSPDNFTETTTNSFTLSEPLPIGIKVLVEIYN